MFRALALLYFGSENRYMNIREAVVVYATCLMQIVQLNANVHMRYCGEDCKALATSVGRNMNLVPVLASQRLRGIATLTKSDLSRIMDFVCDEKPELYEKRMLGPNNDRGGFPELVAAGAVLERHIQVTKFAASSPYKSTFRVNLERLALTRGNTLHLVCVDGDQYHACS